jgi:hypothetical protein
MHLFSIVVASSTLMGACRSPTISDYPAREGASAYIWTELDQVEAGLKEAQGMAQDPTFSAFFDGAHLRQEYERGVVRFETQHAGDTGTIPMDVGTGLTYRIEDGLCLLTARHILAGVSQPICRATAQSGQRLDYVLSNPLVGEAQALDRVVLSGRGATDALMPEAANKPSVRAAKKGEPVVITGYPLGMIGVGADGRVRSSPGPLEQPLEPIYVLGLIESLSPLSVEIVAGTVPSGGMSGSPVWGSDGSLLGILTTVSRKDDYPGYAFSIQLQGLEGNGVLH